MKTILLPTDFSDASKFASEYIFDLNKDNDVRYHLVNTYEPPSSSSTFVSIDDIVRKDALESLQEEIEWMKGKGIAPSRITSNVIFGDFVSIINEEAVKIKADYIALGTTGASGLKEIIGSNASNLISDTTLPVLAIPMNFDPHSGKILFPINLSEENEFTNISLVKEVAKQFNVGIEIFYASSPGTDDYTIIEGQKAKLTELLQGIEFEFTIEKCTDVTSRILQLVDTDNYSMLVMMPHKYSFFERLFSTSVTSNVSMKTRIPLFAIH